MGKASNRLAKRREAQRRLDEVMRNPGRHNVIHYSCESFDKEQQRSGRVTSIAVLNAASGESASFSIHQVADEMVAAAESRKRMPAPIDPYANYAALERALLQRFCDFVRLHGNHVWMHWNMRDILYGFQAIEHWCRVLGVEPATIPEAQRFNIAEVLTDIYGNNYVWHKPPNGRLENTMGYNGITDLEFLRGDEEGVAFVNREYVKLHRSTLRKVRVIYTIAERVWNGTLKTQGSWWERHGSALGGVIDDVTDNPWVKLVGGVLAVIGLVASILQIASFLGGD
jgi:hypothetical protein